MTQKLFNEFQKLPQETKDVYMRMFEDFAVNPMLSYQNMSETFTKDTGLASDRKSIAFVMDKLGFPKRSEEMVRLSKKTIGTINKSSMPKEHEKVLESFDVEKIVNDYTNSQMSIVKLAEKYNTTPYVMKNILLNAKVDIRENHPTFKQTIDDLAKMGWDKEKISTTYLDGRSWKNFQDTISLTVGYEISETSLRRILHHLGISKSDDLIKIQQGTKSRTEKDYRLNILKNIGFENPEDVAKYYNTHSYVSYEKMVKILNSLAGAEVFSNKWFQRNVLPFIDHRSRTNRGVSREENMFFEWLEENISKDLTIVRNDRTVIYPQEVDFYIPEKKIAIEFNGLPWHENEYIIKTRGMTSAEFHGKKKEKCKEKGVELIFVWVDDWAVDRENVKHLILRKINEPAEKIPFLEKLVANSDMLKDGNSLFEKDMKRIDKNIASLYKKLGTVSAVADHLESSRAFVRASLKRSGIETGQTTYLTVARLLKEKGVEKSDIEKFYVDENHTRDELIWFIGNYIGRDVIVGYDLLKRLLEYFEIKK